MARAPNGQFEENDDASEQAMLARAMAATEDEIFKEALGEPEDENTGDTSLEQMGDELGDDVDPEEDEETDPAVEEADHAEGEQEPEQETAEPPPPEEPRQPVRAPSWAAPQQDATLALLADIQSRLTRIEQPQRTEPRPAETPTSEEIDPVLDPKGFREAVLREARGMTEAAKQEMRLAMNFDSMHQAYEAEGRGQEFAHAAGALDRLTKTGNAQDREIVRSIVNARDPARALMEWAEDALNMQEFRDQNDPILRAAQQLGVDPEDLIALRDQSPRQNDRGRQRQSPPTGSRGEQRQRQPQQQPRSRLPSLNSAGGAGRDGGNRNLDMRGMDGSEESIFDYAIK